MVMLFYNPFCVDLTWNAPNVIEACTGVTENKINKSERAKIKRRENLLYYCTTVVVVVVLFGKYVWQTQAYVHKPEET